MMNESYWKKYREFWDSFLGEWFKYCEAGNPFGDCNCDYGRMTIAYNDFFKSKNEKAKLNLDELPEPYYGFPQNGVKAVILNLNPGMSQGDESIGTTKVLLYKRKISREWTICF